MRLKVLKGVESVRYLELVRAEIELGVEGHLV
jgi:hypothetical protein